MKPYLHNVEYKGYLVTCVNGVYRIPALSWRREYLDFNTVKAVIDKQEAPENFVNVGKNHR